MQVYKQIDNLSIADYKQAFTKTFDSISSDEIKMLEINLTAPNHTITATKLAKRMGFANYRAANLKYGGLARKLCDVFKFKPSQYLYILVYLNKLNNEWHWTLKENVIRSIFDIGLIRNYNVNNSALEIIKFNANHKVRTNTTSETISQSRIGQGLFRAKLVEYWERCSVTGCEFLDILKASHIKPWRYSNDIERLDVYNGLLLMPNLDALFDFGYVSFGDDGELLISNQLDVDYLGHLGLSSNQNLKKIENHHKKYLKFHRNNIFQK